MKTSLIPSILAPLGFSSCRENHVATNPPGEHKETTIINEAPRTAEKTRKLRQKPVPMATSPRRKKRQIANKCLQPLLDGGSKAGRVHIGGRRFYRRLTGFQITLGFRRKSCQDLHPDHRSNVTIQESLPAHCSLLTSHSRRRATPWDQSPRTSQALTGRDNACAAPSGLAAMGPHSQGVALGWHVPRRWRSSPTAVLSSALRLSDHTGIVAILSS
jgi:hypothetical protein